MISRQNKTDKKQGGRIAGFVIRLLINNKGKEK